MAQLTESGEFWRRAAASRAATQGRRATPSETLIRQDRDHDSDRHCAEAASRVPELGALVRLLGQEQER